MLSDWQDEIKYIDGKKVKRSKQDSKPDTKAAKDGKYRLFKEGHIIGLPVKKDSDIKIKDKRDGSTKIDYVEIKVSDPLTVYYVISDSFVIKAEDPKKTNFRKEYNGD